MLKRIVTIGDVNKVTSGEYIVEMKDGQILEKYKVKGVSAEYLTLVSADSGNFRIVSCPKGYFTEDHWYYTDHSN